MQPPCPAPAFELQVRPPPPTHDLPLPRAACVLPTPLPPEHCLPHDTLLRALLPDSVPLWCCRVGGGGGFALPLVHVLGFFVWAVCCPCVGGWCAPLTVFFVAVSLPCSLQRKLPLMLCGDFNSPTSSAVYKLLASNSDHDRLRWGVQACKSSQWLFEQSVSAIRAPCFTPCAFIPRHAHACMWGAPTTANIGHLEWCGAPWPVFASPP